jgi:hypothetical protein
MTELATTATRAPEGLSIDHHAHAYAPSNRNRDKVVHALPGSKELFGHGQGMNVVVEVDRERNQLLQEVAQGGIAPAQDG